MPKMEKSLSWGFEIIDIFCNNAVLNICRYLKRFYTYKKINSIFVCISQLQLRPAPPPRADPRALAFFFALDGKFPGVGTIELSNPPGWRRN